MSKWFAVPAIAVIASAANAEEALPPDAAAKLAQAKAAIEEAATKASGAQAVPLYDEPLQLLEGLAKAYPEANEASEIAGLRAVCYDRQGRYPEKHAALRRHADLSCPGDSKAAARVLEQAAHELVEQEEITEATLLYRLIIAEYRATRSAPRSHLRIGQLLARGREDMKGTVREFRQLVTDFPDSKEAELVEFELIKLHIERGEVFKP